MTVPRSLQLPGPEYSEEEERQFRRELEDYLLNISSDIDGAQTRLGTVSSQATKRSLLSMIPVGQSEGGSGTVISGYFSGNRAIPYGSFTYPSTLTYYELTEFGGTVGYVNEVTQDFAEDGYTGDIVYTGTPTGKFLVQYGASLKCNVYLSHFFVFLRIAKNGTAVSGSAITDNYYGVRAAYGSWFRIARLSGAIIVELKTDDTISIEIGLDAVSNNTGNIGTLADTSGVNLCITGVND